MRVCGGWDGGGRLYTFSNFLKKIVENYPPWRFFTLSNTHAYTRKLCNQFNM